ncbi:hypothetical protein L1049_013192 [Liquidambar formosana]|uniref:Phospho-2-dehydro-3-deoxyheptonate aldolase n=1 Tax=Liquidambar formosana TaxID=63359 RepID=A0AAP0RL70_LIQFO
MSTGGHLLHFKNVNTPINLGNAMSFELTSDTTIMELLRMCKLLNPYNEAGKLIVIVKIDILIIGQLEIYLRAVRKEEIAVTWVINPIIGLIGHKTTSISLVICSVQFYPVLLEIFHKD